MDDIRVLIADGDEDYRFMMAEIMDETQGICVAGEAGTTADALELLSLGGVDVLLLDLLLPGNDGVFLLEKLSRLPDKPAVVVNTSFLSPMLAQGCSKHKVAALLQKPSEADTVLERIRAAAQYRAESRPAMKASNTDLLLGREATKLINALGFYAQYKGYFYLRDAVVFACRYGQVNRGTLKMIYADTAHLHGVTAACVERDIRTASKRQYKETGSQIWKELMGICPPEGGFANMGLISAMTEYIGDRARRRKII